MLIMSTKHGNLNATIFFLFTIIQCNNWLPLILVHGKALKAAKAAKQEKCQEKNLSKKVIYAWTWWACLTKSCYDETQRLGCSTQNKFKTKKKSINVSRNNYVSLILTLYYQLCYLLYQVKKALINLNISAQTISNTNGIMFLLILIIIIVLFSLL